MSPDDFAGLWRLERRIDDRLAGQVIAARGTARLVADGAGGLVYDEEVLLKLPGRAPVPGHRRYLWQKNGEGFDVRFADGRFFHRIDLSATAPACRHDCAPDLYKGRHDFAAWPVWSVSWRVRGPRKDYRMQTTYRRAG